MELASFITSQKKKYTSKHKHKLVQKVKQRENKRREQDKNNLHACIENKT
jgi:hypothetical protein